jgi:hypothetical protein
MAKRLSALVSSALIFACSSTTEPVPLSNNEPVSDGGGLDSAFSNVGSCSFVVTERGPAPLKSADTACGPSKMKVQCCAAGQVPAYKGCVAIVAPDGPNTDEVRQPYCTSWGATGGASGTFDDGSGRRVIYCCKLVCKRVTIPVYADGGAQCQLSPARALPSDHCACPGGEPRNPVQDADGKLSFDCCQPEEGVIPR